MKVINFLYLSCLVAHSSQIVSMDKSKDSQATSNNDYIFMSIPVTTRADLIAKAVNNSYPNPTILAISVDNSSEKLSLSTILKSFESKSPSRFHVHYQIGYSDKEKQQLASTESEEKTKEVLDRIDKGTEQKLQTSDIVTLLSLRHGTVTSIFLGYAFKKE